MGTKRMRTSRQQLIEEPATLADRTANGAGADAEPARELALEEGYRQGIEAAAKLIECGCKALLHGKGECQFPGNCSLEDAAAIRALGTSREQLNKAVSNVPDQQENEPGAHGERERVLEEAEHAVGATVLSYHTSDFVGLDSQDAFEAGQLSGLECAQACLRALRSRAISSPDHTQCCNGLSPQECADVPSRHCDGMRSGRDHNADVGKTVDIAPTDAVAICKTLAPFLGATDANDWTGLKDEDAISMTVKLRVGDLRALKNASALPSAPSQEVAVS